MNISIKQVAAILSLIGIIVGAAWALDKRYTPREITDLHIADLQRNQMVIQHNNAVAHAQNWYFYWQNQVSNLERICGGQPWNQDAKNALINAKAERDRWHREVTRLQQIKF